MIYTLDFETFWDSKRYSLSRMGPIEYVRDERFEPQLVSIVRGLPTDADFKAMVFQSPQMEQALAKICADGNVLVGHNLAGFDALVLSEHFNLRPKVMWDTIAMANWTGVSRLVGRSHAALTKFFGTGEKKQGTVVSDGKHWPKDFTPDEQAFFARYCSDDARQCALNAGRMLPYMTDDALRFMSITARMATEPVFELDMGMIAEYIQDMDDAVARARRELLGIFKYPDEESFLKAIRSPTRFAVMLRHLGVAAPMKVSESKTRTLRARFDVALASAIEHGDAKAEANIRHLIETELPVKTHAFSKQDLDFLALREHPDLRVQALVNARLELNSSVNRSRAERFLVFAGHNKPVPITLSAFNAHTGRYTAGAADASESSDRLQFQNLSKRDPAKAVLRKAIHAPAGHAVVACDSSQVEARCLAWVAGETELVEQFRQGRDPYAELAAKIFNGDAQAIHDGAKHGDKEAKRQRNIAKVLILSCGYGTSHTKFADTLLRQGTMLGADVDEHRVLATQAHATYRANNPNIVAFWRVCQEVILYMAEGRTVTFGGPNRDLFVAGPMEICSTGVVVPSIKMPNGFIMRYPNLRQEVVDGKIQFVYDRPKGKNMIPTRIYGASCTENCIQSFAFQILVWQACRMDEAGISIKCNIHDSFATVVPTEQAESTAQKMLAIMKTTPPWAEGLPIDAEVETGTDFSVV